MVNEKNKNLKIEYLESTSHLNSAHQNTSKIILFISEMKKQSQENRHNHNSFIYQYIC